MCLMCKCMQSFEVFEDNGLQWFYDVGVVFKHTHLKYGLFLRNNVFFLFSFNKNK